MIFNVYIVTCECELQLFSGLAAISFMLSSQSNLDIQDKVENQIEALLAEIVELKSERQKCQEEFGAQRGKMKELFLQKEGRDGFKFFS